MTEHERRVHVLAVERVLDREPVGLVPFDQFHDAIEDFCEAFREVRLRVGANHPALDERGRAGAAPDHTIAGDRRAGIDAQDDQRL